MSSKFFTNSSDRGLFDKFTGIIDGMRDLYAFHGVVGAAEIFEAEGSAELAANVEPQIILSETFFP